MNALLIALLLAQAPAAEKPKLAVLELTAGTGVDASVTGPLTEAVVNEVSSRGYFQVVSQKDIETLLGVERQKQLMGCTEESQSCLTELSGAVGARFVLSGTLAKLGDAWQLTLATLDSKKAQPLGRSTRLAKELGVLTALLPFAVAEATATPAPPARSRVLPISMMAVGGAGLVFGLVWGVSAFSADAQLQGELKAGETGTLPATLEEYRARADAATTNKWIAGGSLAVGAALFAVGLLFLPSNAGADRVALVPTGNGLMLVGVVP